MTKKAIGGPGAAGDATGSGKPHPYALPRLRTLDRWRKLAWGPYSLLRALQYEALEGTQLKGRTLDIGGGARNSYHRLLRIAGEIRTINIDPSVRPSVMADLNRNLPFPNDAFDNVISLNTFEHLMNDSLAIREAFRVLRSGGRFVIMVPFLYRVHGSPSDFHRHTADWWARSLNALGVALDACEIEPLVWDRRSSGAAVAGLGGGLRRALLLARPFFDLGHAARVAMAHVPVLRDRPWRPGASRLSAEERRVAMYRDAGNYPLGYFIHGSKSEREGRAEC